MRRKTLLRACALSVLTALSLGSSNIAFAADVPYPVSATLEVGGEIVDMAVDETSGTAYILKAQSQQRPTTYSLVVINGTTITATIPIEGDARQIGVDSGDHTVYVTAGDKVFVIKGTSVTNTITVGQGPHYVAVDSSSHTAYVSQIDGASVALINGGSVTNTVRLPYGQFPTEIVVDSMTHTAYVLVELGNGPSGMVYSGVQTIVNGVPKQHFQGELPSISALAFDPVENRLLFWNMGDLAEYKDGKVTQFPDFFPDSDRAGMRAYDAETRTFFFAKSLGGNESGYEITAARDGRFQSLGKFTIGHGLMALDPVHDKVLLEQLDKVIVMDNKWPDPKAPQGRDADGFADVLARDGAGNLWMYPGDGTGGWLPQRQVGTGWNVMSELTVPGDFNGDTFSDVLARDAAGYLWMYAGDGKGGWLPQVRVGAGWNVMSALTGPGDFNGDSYADLLARDTAGNLWMYPGNGTGGWLPQVQVGTGWNAMAELTSPGDFNGDSYADLLARDAAGNLWMYPGNGTGGWLPQVRVGAGWNGISPIL